jgi:hypothetical protein
VHLVQELGMRGVLLPLYFHLSWCSAEGQGVLLLTSGISTPHICSPLGSVPLKWLRAKRNMGSNSWKRRLMLSSFLLFIKSRGVKIVARELKFSRDKSQSAPMFKYY